MSKKRFIDTDFWSDNWVDSLGRDEKFFFMYLLTNDKTSIAGVYEIPLRMIAFESTFSQNEVIEMFRKLKAKVMYIDGWVVMRNGIKNQNYKNSKIQRGIEIILQECPSELLQYMNIPKDFTFSTTLPVDKPKQPRLFDESSMSHHESSHSDTDSEFNTESNSEGGKPPRPKQVLEGSAKRQYAIAMKKEREQELRVSKSSVRKGSGLEAAKAVADRIKAKQNGEGK